MVFDPKKPNNNMPLLPFNVNFRDSDLLIQLGKTNVALAQLNGQAKQIPNQRVLLDFLSVREWVQSNEIENIHTTIADVFMAEIEKNDEQIKKADKETMYYKEAIHYGFSQIKERGFLATNDYVKINNILLGNTAGIVSSPNKAIKNKKGDILYTPPQWIETITRLLKNLEDSYNLFDEAKEIDPLLKLPLLHYQFEAIHPFGDGNGRTGRILMILFLVLHEKLELPILFLSDFISKNKDDYYEYLQLIDRRDSESIKKFLLWMLLGIEIQALKTMMSISKIQILMEEIARDIKMHDKISGMYSKELIDFLFIRPYYSIEWLEKALGVHRNTASTYLNNLEEAWILKSFKNGRSRIFFFEKFLETLNH